MWDEIADLSTGGETVRVPVDFDSLADAKEELAECRDHDEDAFRIEEEGPNGFWQEIEDEACDECRANGPNCECGCYKGGLE